jgi:hypothetical protein
MLLTGLEAALWCALGLFSPALLRRWGSGVSKRLGEWTSDAEKLGPWAHGILPAYLALIRGAVLKRGMGLQHHSAPEWIAGILACGLGLAAAAYWMRRRPATKIVVPHAWRAALDEPRWALYRAAGILWTGSPWAGVAVGTGLMMAEWALAWQPWRGLSGLQGSGWGGLARGLASSAFFLGTWNLWLTMATQTGVLLLVRQPRRPS